MLKFWPFKAPAAEASLPQQAATFSASAAGPLCAVFSSYSPVEAHIIGGMLEDNGIECVLSNEFIAAMESPISNVTGGVQVLVRVSDAARELLREAPTVE